MPTVLLMIHSKLGLFYINYKICLIDLHLLISNKMFLTQDELLTPSGFPFRNHNSYFFPYLLIFY